MLFKGRLKKLNIFVFVALFLAVAALFGAGTAIYAAVSDAEPEYIYFDLAAGNVEINGSSYTGCAYKYNGSTYENVTISGTIGENQAYYVYQSVGGSSAPDGYFTEDDSGNKTFTIPQRTPVKIEAKPWADYITNNSDVEDVINGWKTATAEDTDRIATEYKITVTGAVNATLVIDDLWSSYEYKNVSRTTGGISFYPNTANSHLTIQTKGDNRFGNIFYHGHTNTTLTFDEKEEGSSLTVANLADDKTGSGNNYWCAAIGGNDGGQDSADGIIFNGGTVFAGSTVNDDCTAIGGGGNGSSIITINGGRVTAAVSSSGAAIGGGIGKNSNGGKATVTITGGEVYAYNFSCESRGFSDTGVSYIPSAAIGGGSSAKSVCEACTVTITGGKVYAQSVGGTAIGGGSSADTHGGAATVTIGGNAYVVAKSISGIISKQEVPAGVAIGGGMGGNGDSTKGGDVTLTIKDTPTVIVGSIGGGKTLSENGKIGSAKVNISGGSIQGQIIMAAGSSSSCRFEMTGGTINNSASDDSFVFLEENGGAIYMDDPNGVATLSGGSISNCTAQNGGALYMTAGKFTLSEEGAITSCTASQNGGAVYMGGGSILEVSGGNISGNKAINGAGAYLASGTMSVSGGVISNNKATEDGGGAYLAGGELTVSGGSILENSATNGGGAQVADGNVAISGGTVERNTATLNGGAFAVTNGNYTMTGGSIVGNEATNGDGGAIFVSASKSDAKITVRSGVIQDNAAGKSGGALGVYGQDGIEFTITIGSNTSHVDKDGAHVCADDASKDEACPIIKNNSSAVSGGAIYLSGSYDAIMNIYCLVEEGNAVGDGVSLSNFMKVEGGTLNITSNGSNGNTDCGNIVINSTVHVTGGKVTISGSGSNPLFQKSVTVDIDTEKGSTFTDKREGGNAYTIQYFENFEENGETSGRYTLVDVVEGTTHTVLPCMYSHAGYGMDGWQLMREGEGDELVPSGDDLYVAGKKGIVVNQKLIFYAKWSVVGYSVIFTPGVDSYKGEMAPQDFAYSDSKPLTLNAFVYVGYRFVKWVDASDPTKTYSDGETVSKLSATHGAKVTLVAVWEICNHTNYSDYTVTHTDSSACRECSCQGYSETVTLSALTAVYNGEAHAVTPTYKRVTLNGITPSSLWSFSVQYSGKSNGNEVISDPTNPPANAGNYTASITVSEGVTISASLFIDRAKQTKLPDDPEHTMTNDQKTVTITDPKDTRFPLEYKFSWYVESTLNQTEWEKWDGDTPPSHTLETTWNNYYIDVRYAQTDNYYASDPVRGTSVIVYTGNVTFEFSADKSISLTYALETGTEGITVTLVPHSEYYIYEASTATDITAPGNYTAPTIENTKTTGDEWKVNISNIQGAEGNSNVTIKIHFSGAELRATVESSAVKDEVFEDISGKGEDDVKISADSAFTACFEVKNYNHYSDLLLSFDSQIPENTTVIMIDRTNGTYWHYTATAPTDSIPITSFDRMGTAGTKFTVDAQTLKLQFAVDFSDCVDRLAVTSLKLFLSATATKDTVPKLSEIEGASRSITLVSSLSFKIEAADENSGDLSQGVEYEYAYSLIDGVGVSKWNGSCGILVITPTDISQLPADARLQVKIGNATDIYSLVDGKFTVALPSVGAGTATLTLLSDMLANEEKTISFNVELYYSDTKVATTPSTKAYDTAITVSYQIKKTVRPAVSAEIDGGLPEYKGGKIGSVGFSGKVVNLGSYTVKATLYVKQIDGEEVVYIDTTQSVSPEVDANGSFTASLDLSSFENVMINAVGSVSFMIKVEIVDDAGKVLDFAPIYFVLIDTRQ